MKTTSYIQRRPPKWRDLPIDLISGDLIRGSPIAHWAPIPLRLIVGYGFMEHGVAKLARGLDAFPAILQALGVPAPHFMGWLTILVELFGGLAVLLGALVPLASIPMTAVLLVAMITVHLPTDSARSSSWLSLLPARSSGLPALKPISFTSRALRPSSWAVQDRWRSMVFWQSAEKSSVRSKTLQIQLKRNQALGPLAKYWTRRRSRLLALEIRT